MYCPSLCVLVSFCRALQCRSVFPRVWSASSAPPPPYTSRLVGCCGPPYLLYVTDYDLENRALSLIGKPGKKSLHLVCASADERAFWFEGLQGLVRPVACVSFVARVSLSCCCLSWRDAHPLMYGHECL